MPTGDSAVIATGPVAVDQPVLTVPARHANTGVLKQAVQPRGMFRAAKPLPAGTPVFGLPMRSLRRGAELIWCAPGVGAKGARPGETVCFPSDPNPMPGSWLTKGRPPFRWVGATGWRLLPTSLRFDASHSGNWASEVVVEERPVRIGDLRVVYALSKIEPAAVTLAARIEGEGGSSPIGPRRLPIGEDGSARLKVYGGELRLIPSPERDQVVVETVTPLQPSPKPMDVSDVIGAVSPAATSGSTPPAATPPAPAP